jgi:hypothetical protein
MDKPTRFLRYVVANLPALGSQKALPNGVVGSGTWRQDFKSAKSAKAFKEAVISATCWSFQKSLTIRSSISPTSDLVGTATTYRCEHGKTVPIRHTVTLRAFSCSSAVTSTIMGILLSIAAAIPSFGNTVSSLGRLTLRPLSRFVAARNYHLNRPRLTDLPVWEIAL